MRREMWWALLGGTLALLVVASFRRGASAEEAPLPIRDAGRESMRDPPRRWDLLDETLDESFPASDPPGNY